MIPDDVVMLLVDSDVKQNNLGLAKLLNYAPDNEEEAQLLVNILLPFFKDEDIKVQTLANAIFGKFKKSFQGIQYPESMMESSAALEKLKREHDHKNLKAPDSDKEVNDSVNKSQVEDFCKQPQKSTTGISAPIDMKLTLALLGVVIGCIVGYFAAHHFALWGGWVLLCEPYSRGRDSLVPGHVLFFAVALGAIGFAVGYYLDKKGIKACGSRISKNAKSCPECGEAITATVIELTSKKLKSAQISKKFKSAQILCCVMMAIGAATGGEGGMGMFMFGFIAFCFIRAMIWCGISHIWMLV